MVTEGSEWGLGTYIGLQNIRRNMRQRSLRIQFVDQWFCPCMENKNRTGLVREEHDRNPGNIDYSYGSPLELHLDFPLREVQVEN